MFLKRTAFVVLIALVILLAGCDWPLWRYGPDQTGYNATENIIGVGNVARLAESWRGDTNGHSLYDQSPVRWGGAAYVVGNDPSGASVYVDAFSATGNQQCSGSPKTCLPMWAYTVGPSVGVWNPPAIANAVLYDIFTDGRLYAFDAAGNANCAGTRKLCSPLWQTTLIGGGYDVLGNPMVANGVIYVDDSDAGTLYAFDAAGNTNCSGSPKACAPLWTAPGVSEFPSPAVANGTLYLTALDGKLYAFDAAGNTNCSGSPKTCNPLWTAATDAPLVNAPSVSGGVVYFTTQHSQLMAFDAAGNTNCSGSPKTCTPLWTATLNGDTYSTPAVAKGVVYVGSAGAPSGNVLYAFNATGTTNCSGSPKTCTPLWTAATGGIDESSPSVANGVVFVGSVDAKLYAFDASGTTNCSGSPKTCTALWTASTGDLIASSPAIAYGWVYVGSDDTYLHAYTLPKS